MERNAFRDLAHLEDTPICNCDPSAAAPPLVPHDLQDMQPSVCKGSIVTAPGKEKAHSSISSSPLKRPYAEKAALEVTCVPQGKKRVIQAGIMGFLAVPEKKQGGEKDKSFLKSVKSRGVPTISNAQSNRCTSVRKPLDFFKPTTEKQRQLTDKLALVKSESLSRREIRERSPFKVDLQLEARLAVEEYAQLSAGKPAHPFFSHQKVGLRAVPLNSKFESASFAPVASFRPLSPAAPFHVDQLPEVDSCNLEGLMADCSPIGHERRKDQHVLTAEFSEQALRMLLQKPFSGRPKTTSKSDSQPMTKEIVHEPLDNTSFEQLIAFLKELDTVNKHKATRDEVNLALTEGGLKDRLKLFQCGHYKKSSEASSDMTSNLTKSGTTSTNALWMDVYQPYKLEQIYGNTESLKSLSGWLQSWQTRSVPSWNSPEGDVSHLVTASGEDSCDEENSGWSEENSGCSGNSSDDRLPQTVIVLTGPVGCGKTSAVYACAKLHGFTVIEVNCSENRNGTLLKQKFGESMESHRLGNWSADNGVAEELGEDGESGENKDRAILLLEDVDVLFEDDRGFMAAISEVAVTAKRPIVMTTNDSKLCIPHKLNACLLEFRRPPTKDLVTLAYLVCLAEGFTLSPQLLQRIVSECNCDTRHLLNYLQFWCQGNCYSRPMLAETRRVNVEMIKEGEKSGMTSKVKLQCADCAAVTLLFCFEAQHRLWPVFISTNCQCDVTMSVAGKLSDLISKTESNYEAYRERKLARELLRKRVLLDKRERRMLDSNSDVEVSHSFEDDNEEKSCETTIRGGNISRSPASDVMEGRNMDPLPVVRKKIKRQLAMVLSDSDDDLPCAVQEQPLVGLKHECLSLSASSKTSRVTESIEMSFLKTDNVTHSQDGLDLEPYTINADDKSETSHSSNNHSPTLIRPLKDLETSQGTSSDFQLTHEAVDSLWSNFRNCSKIEDGLFLSMASKESLSLVHSLSVLSDNLSACDLMSYAQCCVQDVVNDAFKYPVCENLECCNRQQICAQIAHKSFQLCIEDSCTLPSFSGEIERAVSVEDMLLAVNDPFTLGKLATYQNNNHYILGQAAPAYEEQDLQRLRRRSSLLLSLFREIPPRAHRLLDGASFYECASYLALMERLKEDQLALGSLCKRRTRSCQSANHPWNLSQHSRSILQSFGNFGDPLDQRWVSMVQGPHALHCET